MKPILSIFLCFISIHLTAQTTNTGSSDAWKKLDRKIYSIDYPLSWKIDTSRQFGTDLFLISPKSDTLDNFAENFNVYVQDLHGLNYTLLKMGQDSEIQLKQITNNFEIIESRIENDKSRPYYSLKYSSLQGIFSLITEQRYFLINEVGFALTFTSQKESENQYENISDKIFNSFEIQQK